MAKIRSCGFLLYRHELNTSVIDESVCENELTRDEKISLEVSSNITGAAKPKTESPLQTRSFLLMRHHDRWDLPKGHVDPGETKLECALRELVEETGIAAADIRLDESFSFKQKYVVAGRRYGLEELQEKQLIIFLAELIRPVEITATEHIGYEWFPWSPPHNIQEKTINPLLEKLAQHWA